MACNLCLTIQYKQMVYLVGGYKLTSDQVLDWCEPHNLHPPDGNIMVVVNRWLRAQGITQTSLLACAYHGEAIFLVVTDRRMDNRTPENFKPFRESERARSIKARMAVGGDVEFVTVPNPY